MVTRLERNRLYGEREALLDEAAEESRLANIDGEKLIEIIDQIHVKHDECIEALQEDHELEDVILAFRKTIRRILKKL